MAAVAPAGSRPAGARARWGLVAVTAVMGLALVGSSAAGYLAAADSSDDVARANAMLLLRSIRRALLQGPEATPAELEALLGELSDGGLRYIALVDPMGGVTASAGEPLAAATSRCRGPDPRFEVIADGARIRAIAPLMPRRGFGPWGPRGRHRRGRRVVLNLELEPVLAIQIRSRAIGMLVVSFAAATILLLAGVVLWRTSVRAERTRAQLAEDRQLKALGQMSAVLGHELRNPLTSLKGHAQLLLEKLSPDHPGRKGAETVVRESTRIETLTAQVLDFARSGTLSRTACDVRMLVRRAIERAEAEPVELSGCDGATTWPLDEQRMEQVLVNLLTNARQASPQDAAVEIVVRRTPAVMTVEVRDRGEGIDPGQEEHVFEPFHTTRVKGTGLGLALAQRIVEGHGGQISAANRPDGGAVFRIELPAGI